MQDTSKSLPFNKAEKDRQLDELLFLAWMYFKMKRSQPVASSAEGRRAQIA